MHDSLGKQFHPLARFVANNFGVVSKVQASICRLPSENRSIEVIAAISIIASFAALFVILRFIAKGWLGITFGKDDWIIGLALVSVREVSGLDK